ncbi:hypothetical protein IJM86_06315 [bacterium]|nr:hypothetical protein [bacterium]
MEIETKGGEEEKLSTLPLEELEKKRTELTAALLKVSEEILRRKTTKNPYRLDNPINSRNVNDIHEIMEKYPNKTWERKE